MNEYTYHEKACQLLSNRKVCFSYDGSSRNHSPSQFVLFSIDKHCWRKSGDCNMYLYSHSQSTTFMLLAVNLMQQRDEKTKEKLRLTGKTTKVIKNSL